MSGFLDMIDALAPMEAASFCGAQQNKRYSGQRESAPNSTNQIPYLRPISLR